MCTIAKLKKNIKKVNSYVDRANNGTASFLKDFKIKQYRFNWIYINGDKQNFLISNILCMFFKTKYRD